MGSLGVKANLPEIIDIRSDTAGFELKQHILYGLKNKEEKTLPTLLLYDDQGNVKSAIATIQPNRY